MLLALASESDLAARGIDISDPTRTTAALNAATDAVRDAAGCPITPVTATLDVQLDWGQRLRLPVMPVTDVASVTVDDQPVIDWRLVDGTLYRQLGWGMYRGATFPWAQVTCTWGYAVVPADIIDLVCTLAASAIDGEYENRSGLVTEAIDDYRRGFAVGEDATVTPVQVNPATRLWLQQRFGASAAVTRS